ncbi:helix-turn-helix domain-containing protein [Streptomyces antibioticus]|uniref:helix-turn-helix domain-containing protein n=1 Tax=Streptomyces antibioticus TaxID=1890 RepID=UPI003721418D
MRDLPHNDDWIPDRRRTIGARIRAERRHQGLTQDQLWAAARLDRRTIQHAEAGIEVKLSTLLRIAWVLEVPLARLVDEDEQPAASGE